jgi:hypothetical protein
MGHSTRWVTQKGGSLHHVFFSRRNVSKLLCYFHGKVFNCSESPERLFSSVELVKSDLRGRLLDTTLMIEVINAPVKSRAQLLGFTQTIGIVTITILGYP